MRSVTASDGVQVAVHELGGDGPPVLLAHAAGFHGLVWRPLAGRLTPAYTCVAPDLRGHGASSPPPDLDFDWRGFAEDVLAVVEGLGLARAFAVGHSSGATALLLAEASRPGTFRAVYCFEPILFPSEPPLGPDRGNPLAERARRRRRTFPSREEAARHYAAKPGLSGFHPDTLRAYIEHGFEDAEQGVRLRCLPEHEALVYEMGTAHDCFGRLSDVRCPVTLARGQRSDHYRPGLFERVGERLPRSRVEVLPGLGHFGPLEDPEAVADSVRRAFAPDEEPGD